jgi:uncharacterized MAPEG superfamily protein
MLAASYMPAVASVAGFYVLSYVPHFLKGYFIMKSTGAYDNNDPRSQVKKLENKVDARTLSLIKRCEAAHSNSLENFAPFASAVALAMLRNAPIAAVNKAALLFLGLRAAYVGAYVSDQATVRSSLWAGSCGTVLYLFFKAYKGRI